MKKITSIIFNNSFLSSSLIMIIGSNATNFLNYIYHLVMARLLSPSQYGELASVISVVGLLGVIPGALSLVIIKYISSAKTDTEVNHLIIWVKQQSFKISFFCFFLLLIVSPFITNFLHINNIWYLLIMSSTFFFSLPALFNRSILQGLIRFKEMVYSVMSENVAKLVLGAIFVLLGFGVGGVLAGWVLAVILGWFLTALYIKPKNTAGLKDRETDIIKSMAFFTIPVVIYSLSTTALYSIDIILVKHFFSPHEAGIYASVSTLGRIIFFATGPIVAVMFPYISQRFSRGTHYIKIFLYSFASILCFSLLLLSIYAIFPGFIISLLYGNSYLEASGLLVYFAGFILLFTLASLLINFNLSLNRTRVVIFPSLAALFQVAGIYLFHQNLLSVIWVSIIVNALLLFSLLIYSLKKELR